RCGIATERHMTTPDGYTRVVLEIDEGDHERAVPVFLRHLSPADVDALVAAVSRAVSEQKAAHAVWTSVRAPRPARDALRDLVDAAVIFANPRDQLLSDATAAARLSLIIERSTDSHGS